MQGSGWMSKLSKLFKRTPTVKRSSGNVIGMTTPDNWKVICSGLYKPVSQCGQVQACYRAYAKTISCMTVYLMRNGKNGDTRLRNALSDKLDIYPNNVLNRQTFMEYVVMSMLDYGNQIIVPEYRNGLLDNLKLLPPSEVTLTATADDSYRVVWRGKTFRPDEVLNFPFNPDPVYPWKGRGFSASLADVVGSIRQADGTRKALLESPTPSIIVKVDGLSDEFSSRQGRKNLAEQYLDSSENGRPWFIPAEAFSVEQVRPLTLNDLAIRDSLELDKRSIAAITGVPPFMVGVGAYNKDEYNGWLRTHVLAVAKVIEQEMTTKLLTSPELYVKLNSKSLMAYDMAELINVGSAMVDRMAMTRNEWRNLLDLAPNDDMEELLALENYIPANMLGQQKKLTGGENDGRTDP